MSNTILISRDKAVACITLNRPERLNSFTAQMHGALAAALQDVSEDPACRAILLTGAGRGFCAGQDLADLQPEPGQDKVDLGAVIEQHYSPLVRLMRSIPKPVIVAVNGVAAGAGANLALHGDIVLAARSAKFIQSFVKIGLLPDAGGTWTLTNILGEARAKALAMMGEPLGAEQAAEWGLIWKVVDDDALAAEAGKLAQHLAAQPTRALAAIKQAIQAAVTSTLDQQLDMECASQRRLGFTADYAEGVAAFAAKRPPVFTGRG